MPPAQKLDGLAFKLKLPALIRLKDWSGASAERTMIEKYNLWVKQKLVTQILGVHWGYLPSIHHTLDSWSEPGMNEAVQAKEDECANCEIDARAKGALQRAEDCHERDCIL